MSACIFVGNPRWNIKIDSRIQIGKNDTREQNLDWIADLKNYNISRTRHKQH